jgi:hypothetical protein
MVMSTTTHSAPADLAADREVWHAATCPPPPAGIVVDLRVEAGELLP